MERLREAIPLENTAQLETRLRRMFPRAVVSERDISGEPPTWYVYRDGGWRPPAVGPWWDEDGLPRIVISREGWLTEANATARGLLGIEAGEVPTRHFTDFVAPGTLEDSIALFRTVSEGHELKATILLKPTTDDLVAVDIHAWPAGDALEAQFRLADDVVVPRTETVAAPASVEALPAADSAFRGYVAMAMSRMSEPTPDGLALRLRRLYPHARVSVDGDRWLARRDPARDESAAAVPATAEAWWADPALPRVRYDAQALILDANDPAKVLLGTSLVGHYWQEFVTPGSTEQVSAMLSILAEVGRAESRFRMPRADGSLVEFDSYTEVQDETFTTVIRPRA